MVKKTIRRRAKKIKGGFVERGLKLYGATYEPVLLVNGEPNFRLIDELKFYDRRNPIQYTDPITNAINTKIQGTRFLESSKAVAAKTVRGIANLIPGVGFAGPNYGFDAAANGNAFYGRDKVSRQGILDALNRIVTPGVTISAPHIWKYVDNNNDYYGPIGLDNSPYGTDKKRAKFLKKNPLPANLTFDGVTQQQPLTNVSGTIQEEQQVNGAGRKTRSRKNKTKRSRK